jgi:hypothetical protein
MSKVLIVTFTDSERYWLVNDFLKHHRLDIKELVDLEIYNLELLRASEGTLSCWSRLHLQSLASINPHWAGVVGYGPFSLWIIHKEGLCPSSGDINRLMMMRSKCRSLMLPKPIDFILVFYLYSKNGAIWCDGRRQSIAAERSVTTKNISAQLGVDCDTIIITLL